MSESVLTVRDSYFYANTAPNANSPSSVSMPHDNNVITIIINP